MNSTFKVTSSTMTEDESSESSGDDFSNPNKIPRNLREKKRRDEYNFLMNELRSMVSPTNRGMDDVDVLETTITFIKNHNRVAEDSRANATKKGRKRRSPANEEQEKEVVIEVCCECHI